VKLENGWRPASIMFDLIARAEPAAIPATATGRRP
jgi:hypothetical protein